MTDERHLPPNVAAAVAAFASELRRRFAEQVLMVRVFGSYARCEADEDSDVDIAVVLADVDPHRRASVIDLATEIGMPRDLQLSPTVFDRTTWEKWRSQERALAVDIEREGVPA